MPTRQPPDRDARSALIAALEARLDTAMGVRLTVLKWWSRGQGPVRLAAAWLIPGCVVLAPAIWWANGGAVPSGGHAKLVSLNLWLVVHFAVLIALSRFITTYVIDIVKCDILPFASRDYVKTVADELAKRPALVPFQIIPYGAATITLIGAFLAVCTEFGPLWGDGQPFPLDLLFWASLSFYTYFASTRVVLSAAFTRAFAHALDHEHEFIYLLDAVNSPVIRGLSRLNRTVLGYWAVVFLVLVSIMLLVLVPPPPFDLERNSPLLFILVPVLGFFSLGVGTLVYLDSEAAIRIALRRFTLAQAEPFQQRINALAATPARVAERTMARIERLTALQDRILAGGRYGSRLGTAVSLALPLAMPALGLIDHLLGRLLS